MYSRLRLYCVKDTKTIGRDGRNYMPPFLLIENLLHVLEYNDFAIGAFDFQSLCLLREINRL